MGVEWNSDANLDLAGLLKSWKRGEVQYRAQVEEAKLACSPCDVMYGCQIQLHECAHNLERAIERAKLKAPNDQAQRPPPETPGRLQQSLTNYLNRPPAQRGGGSLQRSG